MTATPQYFSLVVIPHPTHPETFVATVIHPNGDVGTVFTLTKQELEQWHLELTAAVVNVGMNQLWDGSLNQAQGENPNV